MADKKSLSDLAELTKEEAAPAVEAEAPAETNEDVTPAPPPAEAAPVREQQLDKQGRAYATGRRKDAIARVWLKPGSGLITVNGREQEVYFARPSLRLVINQPFDVADRRDSISLNGELSGSRRAARAVMDRDVLHDDVRGGSEGKPCDARRQQQVHRGFSQMEMNSGIAIQSSSLRRRRMARR